MEKTIRLNEEDARKLYEMNPELRDTILKNFSNKELGIDTFPKRWEDLGHITGYFIGVNSNVRYTGQTSSTSRNRNVIVTKEDAKSFLAECQLRHLAKVINDNEVEEEWIDWNTSTQDKFHPYYNKSKNTFSISISYLDNNKAIYFKRYEDLERSLIEHRDLWLKYFKAT